MNQTSAVSWVNFVNKNLNPLSEQETTVWVTQLSLLHQSPSENIVILHYSTQQMMTHHCHSQNVLICYLAMSVYKMHDLELPQWHKLTSGGSIGPAALVSVWAKIRAILFGL